MQYSSTNDFFGFPNDIQSIGPSFPVVYEGSNLLEVSLDTNFILPSVIQNISEIDTIGLNIFTDNKVIYEGCEQIFNALSYFADIRSSHERLEKYLEVYDGLGPKFDIYREQKRPTAILTNGNSFYYDKEVIKDFINSFGPEELFAKMKDFTIHVAIPLIIVGPNNGLIRVDIKNDKVSDLVDTKYCAYLYAPREIKPHSRVLIRDYNFAVIICNIDHLDECLNDLENGVRKSVDQIMSEIRNKPYLVYYEIYNNSYNATRSP